MKKHRGLLSLLVSLLFSTKSWGAALPVDYNKWTVDQMNATARDQAQSNQPSRNDTFYNANADQWLLEPGAFHIDVGSSSRGIRLSGDMTLP